jgi:hypothetical protein
MIAPTSAPANAYARHFDDGNNNDMHFDESYKNGYRRQRDLAGKGTNDSERLPQDGTDDRRRPLITTAEQYVYRPSS